MIRLLAVASVVCLGVGCGGSGSDGPDGAAGDSAVADAMDAVDVSSADGAVPMDVSMSDASPMDASRMDASRTDAAMADAAMADSATEDAGPDGGPADVGIDALPPDSDGDGFTVVDDCNDDDPTINPGATEIPYDGIDQDCMDGDLRDVDGDGFEGDAVGGPDCNDAEPGINPDATEVPYDGTDQDCMGGDLRDVDGDGFEGSAVGGVDCNDMEPAINPSAAEACDGVDNNCASGVDEFGAMGCTPHYIDSDGDGFGAAQECTCGPTFPYTETTGGDCFDGNGNAFPGQTAYFAVDRGDGSFDYDCSGAGTPQFAGGVSCRGEALPVCVCDSTQGWLGVPPACGVTGRWVVSCGVVCTACMPGAPGSSIENRQQGCR